MKFQNIIESVYFNPWSITDAGWWDVHRIVKPHLLGAEMPKQVGDFMAMRARHAAFAGDIASIRAATGDDDLPDFDFFGNPIEKMQVAPNGTAVIPIFGTLLNHASLMSQMCGATSYQRIQSDLKVAGATPEIRDVVLKIGSPGGMCNGMKETSDAIFRLRETGKRVRAVADTMIGSAAFALATSCESIAITESTTIGSVGAFCAMIDQRKAFEAQGLLVEVFRSGDYKGAGMPGTSLTEKQREEIQSRSDYYGAQFRELVNSTRTIEKKLLQGQEFIGRSAIESGFADIIIQDIGDGCAPVDEDGDADF